MQDVEYVNIKHLIWLSETDKIYFRLGYCCVERLRIRLWKYFIGTQTVCIILNGFFVL